MKSVVRRLSYPTSPVHMDRDDKTSNVSHDSEAQSPVVVTLGGQR